MFRQLTFKALCGAEPHKLCYMEPGEKFLRRLLTFVFMILAFVVAIVFDEFHGTGRVGALIFVIGAAMGALGAYLWKTLKKLTGRIAPVGSVLWSGD